MSMKTPVFFLPLKCHITTETEQSNLLNDATCQHEPSSTEDDVQISKVSHPA